MSRIAVAAAFAALSALPCKAAEEPVAPYAMSDANAGVAPARTDALYKALHEKPGIDRIVTSLSVRVTQDPRIADIFKTTDFERLRRTLAEEICLVSGGPCHYTGRDMHAAHADQGLQTRDFDALIENLQASMAQEGIGFRAQNQLLAKLAPLRPKVVQR